jgi:hypothetical protein
MAKRRNFKERGCPKCHGEIGVIRGKSANEPLEMLGCVSNTHVQVQGTYGYDLADFPLRKDLVDFVPSRNVKVLRQGKKKPVYLEQPKFVSKKGMDFVAGYEINREGEAKVVKGGAVLHLIQLGEGVTVVPQKQSKMYGDLHDATEGK